jgi:pimeloyl-ACP methyl ester carboxylesterase
VTGMSGGRGRHRRVWHWIEGIVGTIVALVLIIPAVGSLYEFLSAPGDAEHFPPPGQMVAVAPGQRLHLHCAGSGGPAVIMDSGLGGTSLDWALVQPKIAKFVRVCSYDRAGMGWSDPGPMPRTPRRIAAELYALLQAAHIAPPYVLVGHSLGGKNIRLFAAEHPDQVAGMVLVDARNEYMDFHITRQEKQELTKQLHSAPLQYRIGRIFGYVRLAGGTLAGSPKMAPQMRTTIALLDTNQKSIAAVVSEGENLAADDIELRAKSTLGDKPLVVLASGENMKANANWRTAQQLQAKLSTEGRLIVARRSGHYIQWAEQDLVVAAVRDVVKKARQTGQKPVVSGP